MPDVDKMDFLDKARKVLVEPSKFFKDRFTEDLSKPAVHVAIVSLIGAVIGFIFSLPVQLAIGVEIPVLFIGALIGVLLSPLWGLISVSISGLIAHLFILLVGGKGGWKRTLKVLAYVYTINVFTTIPFVGILPALYGIYLTWVGYRKQHNLTGMRAAIAILLPVVLVMFLVGIMVLVMGVALAGIIGAFGAAGGLEGLENAFV